VTRGQLRRYSPEPYPLFGHGALTDRLGASPDPQWTAQALGKSGWEKKRLLHKGLRPGKMGRATAKGVHEKKLVLWDGKRGCHQGSLESGRNVAATVPHPFHCGRR